MTDQPINTAPRSSLGQDSLTGLVVVLGTGLIKTAAAIGMFSVLQAEKIPIRLVVGGSTGAIFAAGFTLGFDSAKMQACITDLSNLYAESTKPPRSGLKTRIGGFMTPSQGRAFSDPTPYYEVIDSYFGEHTFEEARVPLQLVVANFMNGQRMIYQQGVLYPYLRASCAIPGFVPPVEYNGDRLTDAAICDPLPFSAVNQYNGAILGMGFEYSLLGQFRYQADYLYQVNGMFINNLMGAQMALNNLAAANEIMLLKPRFGVIIELMDTHYIPFIIEKGAEATQQMIPYLRKVLENSPASL